MNLLKKLMVIIIGATFISVGVNSFIMPHYIVDGGIIGVAIVLNYMWDLSVGMSFVLLSFPIFLVIWFFHRSYCMNSIVGMIVTGIFIDVLNFDTYIYFSSPLFSALLGGLFLGAGIGILFLYDISTDSIDLLAQFISFMWRLNVGITVFIFDLAIVVSAMTVLPKEAVILSMLTITTNGVMTTLIVSRANLYI
ncbi:YitT family protein [Bacillus shivajii]|nr:YitT family protein [Bacillus shivajii]